MSTNQALDPNEAATLFRAGEAMAFTSAPTDPFVYGRWMGNPCLCVTLPFDDATAYFTAHPVILASSYVPPPPGKAAGATLKVSGAGWTAQGPNMAVELTLTQRVDLTVAYTDGAGAPAPKPGPVTWSSSDETIALVNADDTDDTRSVVSSVAVGTATISAVSGGITATLEVTVAAGAATAAAIEPGEPYEAPAR